MDRDEVLRLIAYRDKEWDRPWETEKELRDFLKSDNKPLLREIGRTPLPTEYGDVTYFVFGDYTSGKEHDVIIFGKIAEEKLKDYGEPLVRIHSSCRSSELFHASNCECREELDLAMKTMGKEKKGVVLYLNQEGAGNGIRAKLSAYKDTFEWKGAEIVTRLDQNSGKPVSVYDGYIKKGYKTENRDFTIAAEILKRFDIRSVRLMTNNPNKINGLVSEGINVKPYGIHIKPANKTVEEHLRAKADKLGHSIEEKDLR